jgi:cytoskeleton protein RodZ
MGQLGDTLRERRIALGISLIQAGEQTRIRSKLLGALEDGEYDKLPNPGYVRGYINSYARYLELDAVPLLAMYRAETGSGRFHEIAPPESAAVSPRFEQHAVPWRVGVIVVVVLAVLSFGIWAVLKLRQGPEKPPPIPTSASESSGTAGSEGTASTSPGVDASKKPAAKYTPFTVKVTIAPNGASYLVITVDGKSAYEGTLTGGHSKSFEVTRKAVLRFGRPDAVTVYRSGRKVDIPNTAGTPTLTLTADPAP